MQQTMINHNNVKKQFNYIYNREYLNCGDVAERDFLSGLLLANMPGRTLDEVELAVGYACRKLSHPPHLDAVLKCVEENIGKV